MRVPIEGARPFGGLLRKLPPTPQCGFPLRGPVVRASIEGLRPFGGLLLKLPPTPQCGFPLRGSAGRASIEGLRPYGGLLCKFPPRSAKLKKPFIVGTCGRLAQCPPMEKFLKIFSKLCIKNCVWSGNFIRAHKDICRANFFIL